MNDKNIQKALYNAGSSIIMEELYVSDFCKELCKNLLKNEISLEEYIERIIETTVSG